MSTWSDDTITGAEPTEAFELSIGDGFELLIEDTFTLLIQGVASGITWDDETITT